MSANDPALNSAAFPEAQIYYFSQPRMVMALIMGIAVTVMPLLILTWFSLDPDWMPEQPDFSGSPRRKRGYFIVLIFWAFFVLFMKLPFWIRIPFLLWSSCRLLQFFSIVGIRAFDRKPDFIISSEGISGWSGHTFQRVSWSAITKINVWITRPRLGSFDIGSPKRLLTFHGPETGPRRLFGTLPPRKTEINYHQGLFPETSENILRIVRQYRPDLVKDDDLVDLAKRG